jgi:hypothetical protein
MSIKPSFETALNAVGNPTAGPCGCGFTSGDVYNEEAFRYFLEVERKRSELSNRPLVLLLLDLRDQSPAVPEIDMSVAQKLFSALSTCVRDTDFVGWYQARSVAGAVLTQHSDSAGADLQDVVRRRVDQALSERLPSELATLVRVHVYQFPSAVPSAS